MSLGYRNAATENTIVMAILKQHFQSLSWKIVNSYSPVGDISLGSCGTSQSCALDVGNGLHEPILRNLTAIKCAMCC